MSLDKVPLALRRLTAEFGMGSGLIALQKPPGRQRTGRRTDDGEQMFHSVLCRPSFRRPHEAKLDSDWGRDRHRTEDHPSSVLCRPLSDNENNQVERAISTGKLHALPRFHIRPIDVVVFHGSSGRNRFEAGFPLRCLQRLSIPYIATLHRGWRHDRSTRDTFTPVLSY